MSSKKPKPFSFESAVESFVSESAAGKKGFLRVAVEAVVLPERQPRFYFDARAMEELVASIRQHGILSPPLVRPLSDERYELVAGERRYRAARALGLSEIPVVVRHLTDEQACEVALLENLQRQDLNPVEETEGILTLLERKLSCSREQTIALLQKAAHPHRDSVNNVIHSSEWQTVERTFAELGRLTPASFRSNRLPLLKLPEEVLQALRRGEIEYTKARAIARVGDETSRRELLAAAIAGDWSLSEIRKQVKQLAASEPKRSGKARGMEKRLDAVCDRIKAARLWQEADKREQLETLLVRLERLLETPRG